MPEELNNQPQMTQEEITKETDAMNLSIEEKLKKAGIEVTDRHKEEFFKAFLADREYQEEFSLMDGAYKIVFRTFSMKDNADITRQMAFDRDKGKIEEGNNNYLSRVTVYKLCLALVSINGKPFANDITSETYPDNRESGLTYLSARADRMEKEWSMIKIAAIQAEMAKFDQRVLFLVDAISQPDFWKAAA